jgi:plastocyanin
MPRAIGLATLLLLLGALGVAASAAPRGANTVNVTIQNFAFAPATVTIDPGDTVHWTNLDSASHSALTVTPGFITAVLSQNQSTDTAFDRPGTYDYICGVHGASMRGTVVVRGVVLATPSPSTGPRGHIVDDRFQQAFPDEFDSAGNAASPYLYATAALVILVLVRVAWAVRHW